MAGGGARGALARQLVQRVTVGTGSAGRPGAAARPGDDGPDVRRYARRGVLGAVLVLVAFGVYGAFAVRPFYPGDETAHANYALEVSHGRLPEFIDRFPPRIPGMGATPTWTAVHGPLYYLFAGWPLRLGIAVGHPVGGLRATRVLTLLLSAVTVVVVARLAAALLPGRPRVAVAGAGLLALVTSYQQVSAAVYNDALAVLAATATLLLIVRAVRDGCGPRLTGMLALAAAGCAATRASGLEVAALAAVAAACPPPGERGRPWRRLVAAAARAGSVGAAVVVTTGWFYARNLRLYGDVAGSARATLGTRPGPASLDNALSGPFWLDQYGQLWGSMTGGDHVRGGVAAAAYGLLAAVALGGALAAGRWAGRRVWHGTPRPPGRLVVAWLVMGVHAGLVTAALLSYVHHGAIPFVRYLFPALPLLPIVAAAGLAGLPGGRRGLPTVAALLVATGIGVAMTGV
ncbi:MAG TPA: glycosyltransferase family 39 protein, partial [Frankiaceae bacterium]|nr:glycosyltransferase family 39 protein [Frankiaceae bacterium]